MISNLDLLHKSESEAKFDRLQWAAQEGVSITDLFSDGPNHGDFILDENELPDTDYLEYDYDNILSLAHETDERIHDIYTAEAIDSIIDFGYLRKKAFLADPASDSNHNSGTFCRSLLLLRQIWHFVDNWTADPDGGQVQVENSSHHTNSILISRWPRVYLTDSSDLNLQVTKIIEEFHLNKEQTFAFKILAYHRMSEPQPINMDQCAGD